MKENKQSIVLDLRIACLLLIAIVGGMLAVWRPWSSTPKDVREITVTGVSTSKAEPDKYQFSPYYEGSSLDEIKKISSDIVTKLKELGVKDKEIKTSTSSYDKYPSEPLSTSTGTAKQTTMLQLTVTTSSKELAQKVEDYLVTTSPKGSISPYITFSDETSKKLKEQGSKAALEDAKKQAEQKAAVYGAKIGKVLKIKEEGNSGIMPYPVSMSASGDDKMAMGSVANLTIQPGENDYTYSTVVIFELK